MQDFPANKPGPRRPAPEKEVAKVERVVTSQVVRRKKKLSKRLSEKFLGEDARSVGDYVMLDVLIPAAKNTIADAVTQGIEHMVFGEVRSTSRRTGQRPGHTAYSRMSENNRRPERTMSRQARGRHNFDEIIIETRPEAVEVLNNMQQDLDKYGQVTVSNLYEMVGITGNYTDAKWGWVDLDQVGVTRVRDGYLLDLPRPEPLE